MREETPFCGKAVQKSGCHERRDADLHDLLDEVDRCKTEDRIDRLRPEPDRAYEHDGEAAKPQAREQQMDKVEDAFRSLLQLGQGWCMRGQLLNSW